jgi:hypothetical protein
VALKHAMRRRASQIQRPGITERPFIAYFGLRILDFGFERRRQADFQSKIRNPKSKTDPLIVATIELKNHTPLRFIGGHVTFAGYAESFHENGRDVADAARLGFDCVG